MKQFQILRYLKKYSAVVAVVSILTGFLFYIMAQRHLQTYTAAVVIEYTNDGAEQGEAPDGSTIDVSEIKSSNIISQTLVNLHYEVENVDRIRSGIAIEPVITEEKKKTQDAKIELGEEYKINPTRYIISFTVGVEYGKEYPRKVLNELLDVYTAYYGKTHVNQQGGTNGINDVYLKQYDYIEMMEVIDDSLENVLGLLDKKIALNNSFRSYDTGYSFMDLYREFYFLKTVDVPQISTSILYQKITKNKDVLLAKYKNRNNDLAITNTASSIETDKIIKIIDTYVEMMSSSDNTNITSEYILDELQENYGYDKDGNMLNGTDQTTEYDRLLEGYVKNRTSYEENLIDTAYNKYILKVFEDAPVSSSEELQQETESRIQKLVETINKYYRFLDETNDEFNEYLGSANMSVLSSVGVTERIPLRLFTFFMIVVFGVIGCVGAIIFGRIEDIVDYYAFTNKVDGLPNRAKCDRYIASREKQLLSADFACVVFKITNLKEENARLGRETGDRMMKTFANVLTSVFVPSEKVFVGYNGSAQYVIFAEDMDKRQTEAALHQIRAVVRQRCEDEEYTIIFREGFACTEEEQCYYIRKLLSLAMRNVQREEGNRVETIISGENVWEEQKKSDESVREAQKIQGENIQEVRKMNKEKSQMTFKTGEDYYEKYLKQKRKNGKK